VHAQGHVVKEQILKHMKTAELFAATEGFNSIRSLVGVGLFDDSRVRQTTWLREVR
jgi:hypothetical protein